MATTDKYDRQLRLWGSNGQKALYNSSICVLGSSALATEFLKNLVLPGIGEFTIVDDAVVSARDFGNNFFIKQGEEGQSRASVTCQNLLELNPDVRGSFWVQSPSEVIKNNKEYFSNFTLVVATQLAQNDSLELSKICESFSIPFLIVRSIGFFSYLRLYVSEHLVVEGKVADKEIFDLRIQRPFAELSEFAAGIQLEDADDKLHKHIPYVVLLLKINEEWMSSKGSLPKSFAEKEEYKSLVKSKSRNYFDEENFHEAVDRSYLSWAEDLPSEVLEIIQDEKSVNADANSPLFWVCANSVKQFIDNEGMPPLTGLFPDMTSETTMYLSLQNLYYNKSQADIATVMNYTKNTLARDLSLDEEEYLKLFIKNLHSIEVTRFSTLSEEMENLNVDELGSAVYDDNNMVDWYIAFRAHEAFYNENGKPPTDGDIEQLESKARTLCDLFEDMQVPSAVLKEFIRFGNCEIHVGAAFLGGVAAQEAVKIMTKQYTPVNNTFVHSFNNSTGQVLQA